MLSSGHASSMHPIPALLQPKQLLDRPRRRRPFALAAGLLPGRLEPAERGVVTSAPLASSKSDQAPRGAVPTFNQFRRTIGRMRRGVASRGRPVGGEDVRRAYLALL